MRRARLEGADLERYLDAMTSMLAQALSPHRIVLFGSFARGDQNRASDVDLVIVADTTLSFCDRIGWALQAVEGVVPAMPVEPLVYTPDEWRRMEGEGSSFVQLLQGEGRVLYERGSERDGSPAVARAGAS